MPGAQSAIGHLDFRDDLSWSSQPVAKVEAAVDSAGRINASDIEIQCLADAWGEANVDIDHPYRAAG